MNQIPITSLISALFALLFIPLTLQVGLARIKTGIFFGDGGNPVLARRRAAQSNFVQYAPFALFLLLLCELQHAPLVWLLAIGGTITVGRVAHAWCLLTSDGMGNLRAGGMICTFLSFLISAIWLLKENAGTVIGS